MIRLAGACLVLFSHSFVLTGRAAAEPVAVLLGGATDGGRLAVGMFFVVSGFLVTRSVQSHRPADYLRARALRLWPALAAAIVAQTLIVGPLCTGMPVAAYLTDPATWAALLRGLLFNPQLGLPDVFATNPLPFAVNGSLWTLRVEAVCYVLLLAACLLGLLRSAPLLAAAAVALALMAWLQSTPSGTAATGLRWLHDVRVSAILECCVHFLMGAVFWAYRDLVPRSALLCGAGVLAIWTVSHTALAPVIFHVVFAYVVLCIGLGPRVGTGVMHWLGDISYGTYLYAFPVQQVLVNWSGGAIGPWRLMMEAAAPVLILAVLSQRLVERPALRFKHGGVARLAVPAPRRMG